MDEWRSIVQEVLISKPWLAAILAAMPVSVPAVIGLLKWWYDRRDTNKTKELTAEQEQTKELNARQATFNADQARWFGELRAENRDLKIERDNLIRDRDRGWNLARWWHAKAHSLRIVLNAYHHYVENQSQWIYSATVKYPELKAPTLDALPPRPTVPLSVEDPKGSDLGDEP